MPDRSDSMRRRLTPARRALLVAVLLLAGTRLAAAQSVTVPTFTVHTAGPNRTTLTVDLAESAEDSVLFFWDDHHFSFEKSGYVGGVSRFSPSGTPLPAASTPLEFQCCANREHLSRIAAYASGTYTSLTMHGYPNDVFYVGWEMDALGVLMPGGWQVDSTFNGNGTTRAGHGGAVATLDGQSIHLVWDDTTATVIGRRLNAAPGVGGTWLVAGPSDPEPFIDLVGVPPDRILAGWGSVAGSLPRAMAVSST
jgi:hypothetical protein